MWRGRLRGVARNGAKGIVEGGLSLKYISSFN